ncbi:hypothetical protein ABT126_45585 [Streptomyces sp. NPDC002012]
MEHLAWKPARLPLGGVATFYDYEYERSVEDLDLSAEVARLKAA